MNGTQMKPRSAARWAPPATVIHLRVAAQPAEHAGRDDERRDELHDR